jgi:hypothetical protein
MENNQKTPKKFIIPDNQLRRLIPPGRDCIICDTIVVEGKPVRFFYRVMPERFNDSGWRFYCGTETELYLKDPEKHGVYDLNIAANYSPEIMRFFDDPPYTAYQLDQTRGAWVDVSVSIDWTAMK